MATVLEGSQVIVYQATVIRSGLKACKVGMRLISGYTPKRLLAKATEFTGVTYKLRQYDEAIADLTKWIETAGAEK